MSVYENTELWSVLLEHSLTYPSAQPQDMVKLVYQNEFGPGHLITDGKAAIERFMAELEAVEPNEDIAPFDNIGNGMARVNLAALPQGYTPAKVISDFMFTAQTYRSGTIESFLGKLEILKAAAKSMMFLFSYEAFCEYLEGYIAAGCPMVSHTNAYKEAYRPAYRVVRKDLLPYPPDYRPLF